MDWRAPAWLSNPSWLRPGRGRVAPLPWRGGRGGPVEGPAAAPQPRWRQGPQQYELMNSSRQPSLRPQAGRRSQTGSCPAAHVALAPVGCWLVPPERGHTRRKQRRWDYLQGMASLRKGRGTGGELRGFRLCVQGRIPRLSPGLKDAAGCAAVVDGSAVPLVGLRFSAERQGAGSRLTKREASHLQWRGSHKHGRRCRPLAAGAVR